MKERVVVDGAQGEGGGQVLRTTLSLALLLGKPVEIINIRANRKKPGLLRQHLTCVLAAKEISGAHVVGATLGSERLIFEPGAVKPGQYHFAIGSAGSTVLVCQTVLLPLMMCQDGPSQVCFEGGTHNGLSPSLNFFADSFLAVLKMMGANATLKTEALGFNPAGGGRWVLDIQPVSALEPIDLATPVAEFERAGQNRKVEAIVGLLSESIAVREIDATCHYLDWHDADVQKLSVESQGPGNSLHLQVHCDGYATMFEAVGQLGVSAEKVARRAAGRLRQFLKSEAAVETHLADQLLLPLVVAGEGSFTTSEPSSHTRTNIDVIRQVTGHDIECRQESAMLWRIGV